MATGDEECTIYHEKQSQMLCGLHAVNNLLQKQVFTRQDFDEFCVQLTPDSKVFNPHRHWMGLGDYDVNVLSTTI